MVWRPFFLNLLDLVWTFLGGRLHRFGEGDPGNFQICLGWAPHPVIVIIRDNKECTITGWGYSNINCKR